MSADGPASPAACRAQELVLERTHHALTVKKESDTSYHDFGLREAHFLLFSVQKS